MPSSFKMPGQQGCWIDRDTHQGPPAAACVRVSGVASEESGWSVCGCVPSMPPWGALVVPCQRCCLKIIMARHGVARAVHAGRRHRRRRHRWWWTVPLTAHCAWRTHLHGSHTRDATGPPAPGLLQWRQPTNTRAKDECSARAKHYTTQRHPRRSGGSCHKVGVDSVALQSTYIPGTCK